MPLVSSGGASGAVSMVGERVVRRLFWSGVFTLLALSALPLSAADQAASWGVAYIVGAGTGADLSLKEVIAGSIGVQLTRRSAPPEELSPAADGPPVLARSLAQAAGRNAQYLLLATYTTTSGDIAIELKLYDVGTSAVVGQATQTGPIDLSMDALVAQALAQAAQGVEFRQPLVTGGADTGGAGSTTAAAGASGAAAATSTGAAASTSGGGATSTGAAPDGAAATGTPAATTPPTAAGPPSAPASGLTGTGGAGSGSSSPRKTASIGITTGAAPLLLTGPAGAYASLGGLATLSVAFRFRAGPGVIGVGILSGLGAMTATGAVTTAQVLLVPVGVDAQYTLNDGGFPAVTLHVGGGPSFLNVTASYAGSLTKIIPYLLAGMTLEVPFASFMGMAVDAAWATFFESASLPIMGFAPEVSFYVRF
jgi:hypothetical protein